MREAAGVARLIGVAANHVPLRVSCLPRSLTLWFQLRRRGIGSDLCIGVRRDGGQLEAHAWVECGGCALNDSADVRQRFTPFAKAIKL